MFKQKLKPANLQSCPSKKMKTAELTILLCNVIINIYPISCETRNQKKIQSFPPKKTSNS